MDVYAGAINPGQTIYFSMLDRGAGFGDGRYNSAGYAFRGLSDFQSSFFTGHSGIVAVRDGDVGAGGGDTGPDGPIPTPPNSVFPIPTVSSTGGYYDPEIAIGYDYVVSDPGVRFVKVQIPYEYGDGQFDLFTWDEVTGQFVDSGFDILRNEIFDFKQELGISQGLDRFSVRGIEVEAAVDPTDPLGFVTGLWFEGEEGHSFQMTPVTVTVVPEPSEFALHLAGLGLLTVLASRRRFWRCA